MSEPTKKDLGLRANSLDGPEPGVSDIEDDLEAEVVDSESEDQLPDGVDPVAFWESRQRELVVSVLNYNLLTLSELIHTNKIDLSPKYQRRSRWDDKRQSALIESFLMNVPVPPVFLNEDEYGKYSVIDGKQRLTSIHNFIRGRLQLKGLKVFSELNGLAAEDIPTPLRNALETRAALQAIIILRQSDIEVKFEVFKRLNTGGVRLNPQEVRNSSWAGEFNNLVLELSETPDFHLLLNIEKKERSEIWREMRDAEFVLRYFTFRHTWSSFSGGMQRHMDEFMAAHQYAKEGERKQMRSDFLNTIACVRAAFGEHAFQRYTPSTDQWRRQVLAALFDAQMFACQGREPQLLETHRPAIIEGMKALFGRDDFLETVNAATNTPSYFRRRVRMVKELLDKVVDES